MVEPKFLGLFVHTLTADDKYYCHHREKFPQGIQMQLSKKASTFYQFFISFLKATSNFEHFEKKDNAQTSISDIINSEKDDYLTHFSPVSHFHIN